MEILHLDTCLLDYFRGFSGHVYSIPIAHDDTYKTVLNALSEAISQEEIYEFSSEDYDSLGLAWIELKESCTNLDAIFCSGLEPYKEDTDCIVYAYFGVKKT